jgi:hypothetical protein
MTKTYTIRAYYKEYFTTDVEANSIQEAKIKALDNQEECEIETIKECYLECEDCGEYTCEGNGECIDCGSEKLKEILEVNV